MVSFSLSFFLIAKNARCNWRNKLAWLMHLSFSLRDIVHQQHSRKMCTLFCKKKSRLILKHKRREAWRSRVNPLHIWYQDTKYAMESRVQLSYLVIVQNLSQSRPLPGTFIAPCSVPKLLGSTSYLHACTIWVTLYGSCTKWMCTRPMSQGRNQFF